MNTPDGDPTPRTTELVDRALAASERVMDTRLAGIDQATKLVAADVARIETRTERERDKAAADVERQLQEIRALFLEQLGHVSDVAREKFLGFERALADRDERVRQASAESAVNLNAALAAQKELNAQQNTSNTAASNLQAESFQRAIDQQAATTTAINKALEDRIRLAETRLERVEASRSAVAETKTETRLNMGQVVSLILVAIAVVSLVIAFRPT